MINIQLRGLKVKLNINSIDDSSLKVMLNDIASKKKSLAELNFESKFDEMLGHMNCFYKQESPILSDDAELIVTAFDNNDYYSEGYSFYREKVHNLIQTPLLKNLKIQKSEYLLINHEIYYGCVFETELDQMSYQYFNSDYFSISSKKVPFIKNTLIDELFFNRLPLKNLNRSKLQLVKYKSALIENNQITMNGLINNKNWSELKYLIKSEKSF